MFVERFFDLVLHSDTTNIGQKCNRWVRFCALDIVTAVSTFIKNFNTILLNTFKCSHGHEVIHWSRFTDDAYFV